MRIDIKNLTFKTIIGILEEERYTPQKVVLHVKMDYDYRENSFINYADVASFLEAHMNEMRYGLLEDALNDLSKKLKTMYPQISKLTLKIGKPTILSNALVGVSHKINYEKN